MKITTVTYIVAISSMIIIYYQWIAPTFSGILRLRRWSRRLQTRYPLRDAEAALQLIRAGIGQLFLFFVLVAVFHPQGIVVGAFYPRIDLIGFGLVLGVGEMALANMFGLLAITVVNTAERAAPRARVYLQLEPAWGTVARGGWLQYYVQVLRVFPLAVSLAAVSFYITVEEVIFRAVIVGSGAEVGRFVSVALSVTLFVLVQIFHTPGWRTAMFPVLGPLLWAQFMACSMSSCRMCGRS